MNKKIFFKLSSKIISIAFIFFVILSILSIYVFPLDMVTPSSLIKVDKGIINLLVMGTDESGVRTDSIMMVSFNSNKKAINILSVPRDTKVTVGKNTQKINAVYGIYNKDPSQTIKYVNELTGLETHYYAVVHPKAFRDAIDILGGVDFDVPMRMKYTDKSQDLYIDLEPGMQHLDGDKAEQLTRFRGYPNADLQRTVVQREFISEIISQKANLWYILKSGSLFTKVNKSITTNIKMQDISAFSKFLQHKDSINSFEIITGSRSINGLSYLVCDINATKALIKKEFY